MKRLFKGCGVVVLVCIIGIIAAVTLTSGGDDGDTTESRCLPVPAGLGDGIGSGLESGITASNWQAVKSTDFEKVYMVAGKLSGPGMGDDTIGVWATNRLEASPGMILAVDGIAQEFSDWPDGDTTDAETSSTDDGVSEARDCVS